MSELRELLARLASLFGLRVGRATDSDIQREFASHVEMQTAENVRRGMEPDEARRQALIMAGGLTSAAESVREQRGLPWLEHVLQDVRYAVRGLLARPLFTSVVVVTLGLGVGVNVVMFGILDRMLVRAPRYLRDPATVHRVYLQSTHSDGRRVHAWRTEYPRYLDFQKWNRSMSELAAFVNRRAAVGEGEVAQERDIAVVSANFFNFFDAPPAAGRYFTPQEDVPPAGDAVAVLTFDYWRAHYAGSQDVLGRSFMIGSVRYTIIGVAPRGFDGISDGTSPIAFIPATTYGASMRPTFYNRYSWTYVGMLARRKPDVSIEAANADLTNAHRLSWDAELRRPPGAGGATPDQPTALAGRVQLARGPMAGQETKVAIWVGGVALIVLVVACANVANLLLARAAVRRREMAVRRAIGGTPGRLMQQVLTESLVLAVMGGAAGVVMGGLTASGLRRVLITTGESWPVISDGRTLAFAVGLVLAAALLAGVFPALQARRGDLVSSLKSGFREGAYRRSRVGTALLLVQTALSVVLLVGAGLFTRSLDRVRSERLGFEPEGLFLVRATMRGTALGPGESTALTERLLVEARTIPGVAGATATRSVPFRGGEVQDIHVAGLDSVYKLGRFELQSGSPEYFATMGTRIVRGRGLSADDRAGAPNVAVVSEAMGATLWRGQDPLGQCFRIDRATAPCTTVVGIAENIKTRGFGSEGEFTYYLPLAQYVGQLGERGEPELFVRMNGASGNAIATLRSRLQRHMPGSSYVTLTPFEEVLDPAMRSWTSGARMFLAFGALALTLAAIGLYGVIAFAVAHRTQEIGMRIALGAGTGNVLRLVIGEGLRVTLAGVAIGTVVALGAANGIGELLFRVSPRDPLVYGSVAATLVIVSIVASAMPAARAARVDPNVALRSE